MSERNLPLRLLLRTETRAVHERLHHLPDFAALAEARIARPAYGRLLLGLHGFYAALDPVLANACGRFAGATGGAEHLPRAPALECDLAALGLDAAPADHARLPRPESAAALAGALYVVDGALIGGTVLARAAGRVDWPAPASFWRWCEAEGPGLWRRTLGLLDRLDGAAENRVAALAMATALFRSVGEHVTAGTAPAG